MAAKIIQLRVPLSAAEAEEIIHLVVADTSRLGWTDHAVEQMLLPERNLVDREVITVLEKGKIVKGPTYDDEHDDWVCVVRKIVAGRTVHVVVGLDRDRKLASVITAY